MLKKNKKIKLKVKLLIIMNLENYRLLIQKTAQNYLFKKINQSLINFWKQRGIQLNIDLS